MTNNVSRSNSVSSLERQDSQSSLEDQDSQSSLEGTKSEKKKGGFWDVRLKNSKKELIKLAKAFRHPKRNIFGPKQVKVLIPRKLTEYPALQAKNLSDIKTLALLYNRHPHQASLPEANQFMDRADFKKIIRELEKINDESTPYFAGQFEVHGGIEAPYFYDPASGLKAFVLVSDEEIRVVFDKKSLTGDQKIAQNFVSVLSNILKNLGSDQVITVFGNKDLLKYLFSNEQPDQIKTIEGQFKTVRSKKEYKHGRVREFSRENLNNANAAQFEFGKIIIKPLDKEVVEKPSVSQELSSEELPELPSAQAPVGQAPVGQASPPSSAQPASKFQEKLQELQNKLKLELEAQQKIFKVLDKHDRTFAVGLVSMVQRNIVEFYQAALLSVSTWDENNYRQHIAKLGPALKWVALFQEKFQEDGKNNFKKFAAGEFSKDIESLDKLSAYYAQRARRAPAVHSPVPQFTSAQTTSSQLQNWLYASLQAQLKILDELNNNGAFDMGLRPVQEKIVEIYQAAQSYVAKVGEDDLKQDNPEYQSFIQILDWLTQFQKEFEVDRQDIYLRFVNDQYKKNIENNLADILNWFVTNTPK